VDYIPQEDVVQILARITAIPSRIKVLNNNLKQAGRSEGVGFLDTHRATLYERIGTLKSATANSGLWPPFLFFPNHS
jgi:hypothetical protein